MHATLGRSGLVACDLILGLHQATRAQAHYKLERPDSLPRNQPAPTRRRTRTRRSGQTRRARLHHMDAPRYAGGRCVGSCRPPQSSVASAAGRTPPPATEAKAPAHEYLGSNEIALGRSATDLRRLGHAGENPERSWAPMMGSAETRCRQSADESAT